MAGKRITDLNTFISQNWGDIKGDPILIFVGDDENLKPLKFMRVTKEDWYAHKNNAEDCGSLKGLEEAHGTDFKKSDYQKSVKKGTLILRC